MAWLVDMRLMGQFGVQTMVLNISSARLAEELQAQIRKGACMYYGTDPQTGESIRLNWEKSAVIHVRPSDT